MFDLDKWQEIIYTMQKNKLRTFLTAFGVFWGIFMLVLLLGFGNGMRNGIKREFEDEAINSLWIWQGRTSLAYEGLKPGREISFKNNDLDALINQVPGIDKLSPRTRMNGEYTINYGIKSASYQVFGSTKDFFFMNGEKMLEGRNVNPTDEKEKRKVAVVGKRAKDVLFEKEDKIIGKYIKIRGIYFQVVGTFTSKGNNGRNEERIYIPFATLQMVFNQPNQVHSLGLTSKENISVKELEFKVKNILSRRHKFDIKDDQAIYINNNEENWKRFQGLFSSIAMFVWGIGVLTLAAGIVGVSNIMLIIVKERTKEIGVRKAIGATPLSIISLIVQESIVITVFSGYFGLLCGVAVLNGVNLLIEKAGGNMPFFDNLEVDFGAVALAIGVLVASGVIAGLFPAIRAANIKPIEALRAD